MSSEINDKIWKKILDIKTAMLVMHNSDGLKACPMQIVQNSYTGKLWFFTQFHSDKSDIINQTHEVCVTFQKGSGFYISLSGYATITRDKTLISSFWNSSVESWFPEGKESEEVALIEIDVQDGEYWDAEVNTLEYIYEMTKANFMNRVPRVVDSD